MHGLAAAEAASIISLSFCSTSTDPAVTISVLSSVALVSAYSDSSLFWIAAVSAAEATEDIATSSAVDVISEARILMGVFFSLCSL